MKYIFYILFLFFNIDCCCQVLSNTGSVINISSGTVINGSSINNSAGTISNAGTITLTADHTNAATVSGNGNYNIGGNWANTGTFTQGTGTVTFNGGGAQNIANTTFSDVIFSGGNTKSIIGNLNIINTITLSANTTLALSSANITLKSTATNTARLTAIPATAAITYGSGKFIVERYIPGRRKYRLITSSVTTSASATLTTGQEALSIWGNWQTQGNSAANIGTIITGGSSADGFDQNTTNASLYTYDAVNRKYIGYTSANSKNTKYTPLKAGIAYYMFVYGDRTNTAYTNTPNYTTISSTGTLLTGDQTYNNSSTIPLSNVAGRYTMLGNPFASPIDWATVVKTNLSNTYWGWDPNLSSTGGYITVSTAGTVTLISPFTGTTGLNQYIQPGQGFFVQTTATSPVLTIKESDKVGNINLNAFRTANSIPLLAVNLFYDNAGVKVLADGTLAAFDKSFSNKVDKDDATKMINAADVIAFEKNNTLLSINALQMPTKDDTLLLNISKLSKSQYTLQIFAQQMQSDLHPFLVDKYLNTVQPLSISDTNLIVFNVTSDAASFDANRFRIVFNKSDLQQTPVSTKSGIKIFPNPITGRQINIQFNEIEKGVYTLRIINAKGQPMFNQSMEHSGVSSPKIISLDKKLPAGIYYLQLINKEKNYTKNILIE